MKQTNKEAQTDPMERVNRILNHDLFIKYLKKNEEAERNREFCGHGMTHFLDVARLAEILMLKERQPVEEELIYAAALLHDIGRFRQYADGTPHEKASAELAEGILRDCGFDSKETGVIIDAIRSHRQKEAAEKAGLTGLLYRADKLSRSCFACKAREKCNWEESGRDVSLDRGIPSDRSVPLDRGILLDRSVPSERRKNLRLVL